MTKQHLRVFVLGLLLYLIALTLVGCGNPTAPSSALAVTVQVYAHPSSVPVPNAYVTLNGRFVGLTDRAGQLPLSVAADYDTLCIRIAADGYPRLESCQAAGWLGGGWSFWLGASFND